MTLFGLHGRKILGKNPEERCESQTCAARQRTAQRNFSAELRIWEKNQEFQCRTPEQNFSKILVLGAEFCARDAAEVFGAEFRVRRRRSQIFSAEFCARDAAEIPSAKLSAQSEELPQKLSA